jgi:hypothetical protein
MTMRTVPRHVARRIAVGVLSAGWVLIFVDDLTPAPLELPHELHDDLARVLVAGTVSMAVAAILRGKALFEAVRLGRLIESESRRRQQRRSSEEITVGIGIPGTN